MKFCHLVPPARPAARDQGRPILAAMSANVDLEELHRNASELVRRAQTGEEITITVSGPPSARLLPAELNYWRRWDEIADLFSGPTDSDWQHDRELVGNDPRDPWVTQ